MSAKRINSIHKRDVRSSRNFGVLKVMEARIGTIDRFQLVMRALLDEYTMIENSDRMGVYNRR